jgi:hypothetical protein
MDEQARQAQEEISSATAVVEAPEETPKSFDDVVAGLKGFGITEFEEIITLKCGGKSIRLRVSNIPTSDEMVSLVASEEFKGYLWIKRVKVEILSRAITWLNGYSLKDMTPAQRLVNDPTNPSVKVDIQVALRNCILGWGMEVLEIMWKVLMTHSQRIEEELAKQFPDNAVMTETEKRLFERARKEIEDTEKVIIHEAVSQLYNPEAKTEEEVAS